MRFLSKGVGCFVRYRLRVAIKVHSVRGFGPMRSTRMSSRAFCEELWTLDTVGRQAVGSLPRPSQRHYRALTTEMAGNLSLSKWVWRRHLVLSGVDLAYCLVWVDGPVLS